jgi:hypothetical protein
MPVAKTIVRALADAAKQIGDVAERGAGQFRIRSGGTHHLACREGQYLCRSSHELRAQDFVNGEFGDPKSDASVQDPIDRIGF